MKTAREVLTELERDGYGVAEYGYPSKVDTALSSLRELVEKVMPKYKKIKGNVEGGLEETYDEKASYNQAIADYTAKLMEVLR